MDHAILAMELCFPMIPGDALQGQRKALVVQQPATPAPTCTSDRLGGTARIDRRGIGRIDRRGLGRTEHGPWR